MNRPPQKLSLAGQLIYSSGNMGYGIVGNLMTGWVVYLYLPPDGKGLPELLDNTPLFLGATLFGLIGIFGRIVDSAADPLVANWTDRSRHRIGRRKIFMLWGAGPLALSCAAMFFPPTDGKSLANAFYLAAFQGLFFFFFTVYVVPLLALLPEFSRDEGMRINMGAYNAFFTLGGAIAGSAVTPVLFQALQTAGLDKPAALRCAVTVMCAVSAAVMYFACLAVDERRHSAAEASSLPLFESLLGSLKDRAFLVYLFGNIAFQFGLNIVASGSLYYVTVLMRMEEGAQSKFMGALFGVALALGFPLSNGMCRRIGKKWTMVFGFSVFSVLMTALYWLGRFPGGLDVEAQGLALIGLMGFPIAIGLAVPNAMLSDIAELNALRTGQRREGMYFGAQGLLLKINLGISTAVLAYLLTFGKSAADPLGVRLTGPAAGAVCLAGAAILLFLDEKGMLSEIRRLRGEKT